MTGRGGTQLYDARYTYDVFARRVGVEENGSQVLWTLYDGANAYADLDGGGAMAQQDALGPNPGPPRPPAGGPGMPPGSPFIPWLPVFGPGLDPHQPDFRPNWSPPIIV